LLTTLPPNATKRFPKLTLQQAAAKGKAEGLKPVSASVANTHLNKLTALFLRRMNTFASSRVIEPATAVQRFE
jgi:hypothetical protein